MKRKINEITLGYVKAEDFDLDMPFAFMEEVHSNNIMEVSSPSIYKNVDALITKEDLVLVGTFSDCVPIYFIDLKSGYRGLAHAGWRGLKSKIIPKVLDKFLEIGIDLKNLRIVIGPCISQKHYEVGSEFLDYFSEEFFIKSADKYYFNLRALALAQSLDYVERKQIIVDSSCTFEDDYHSYRREKNHDNGNIGYIK